MFANSLCQKSGLALLSQDITGHEKHDIRHTRILSWDIGNSDPTGSGEFLVDVISSSSRSGNQLELWHMLQKIFPDRCRGVDHNSSIFQLFWVGQGAAISNDVRSVFESKERGVENNPCVKADNVML